MPSAFQVQAEFQLLLPENPASRTGDTCQYRKDANCLIATDIVKISPNTPSIACVVERFWPRHTKVTNEKSMKAMMNIIVALSTSILFGDTKASSVLERLTVFKSSFCFPSFIIINS